jgi:hypothetical protein
MANTLGALIVRLGLDASDFTTGLSKSEAQAQRFAQTLDGTIAKGIIKAEIAIRAFGAAVKATFQTFQTLTTGAGEFKDLEESTGATAEQLASLAVAGATAGVSMEAIATSANKLTKNLVGVDDESKAAGAALAAIGLNVKDFKDLDPVAQYEAVGKALGNFADGAGKVAVAQALFGKNGAEQLRVFKALDEAGGRQVILTQQQIDAADAYADQQAKSRAQLRLYAQAAASEALPAIADLTAVTVDLAKEFLGVDSATGKLAANNGAKAFAEGVADAFAFVADQILLVTRLFETSGKFIGAYGAAAVALAKGDIALAKQIGAEFRADLDEINARKTFAQRLATQRLITPDNQTDAESARLRRQAGIVDRTKPALKFNFDSGAAAQAEAELRKRLDGQLKAIKDFAQQQKDAFDFANQSLKDSYDEGLVSLQQFFDAQANLRAGALQEQLAAIDKEIAAQQQFRSKANNQADRLDATNKIAEAERQRAAAIVKASRENVLAAADEARAVQQLARSYVDLQAQVLDLEGDKRGAAGLRIAGQVAEAQKRLRQVGVDPAIAERLERQLSGAADLADAQDKYNRLLERARDAEDEIALAAQRNGLSEIDTLRALGTARQQSLQQLAEMVERANELALALGTPDAIKFAEQLGAAFKRAVAEVDPLLGKIRDIGGEAGRAIAEGLADAALEGKNLVDTFHDIDKALARIALNELFTKPFQNWLQNMVGGNGQASGGGGWIGAVINAVGGWFGGGKAIGGRTEPYSIVPVAENRPEVISDGSQQWLVTGRRSYDVDPNPKLGMAGSAGVVQHIAFHVTGGIDRQTQTQLAARVARSAAQANARNN